MIQVVSKPYSSNNYSASRVSQAFDQLLQRSEVGFFQSPVRTQAWLESQELAQAFKNKFKSLVVVGVGGSSLGARALHELKADLNTFFIDNVDPFELQNTLRQLNLKETCFCFISKSGSTIETLATLEVLDQLFQSQSLQLSSQSLVITEAKSNQLSDWARSNQVPILSMPDDVGGRYSVLTSVGLFPAAWMGYSLDELRDGAKQALREKETLISLAQQYLESFLDRKNISVFWFYSSQYRFYGAWLQQLWAESLAKKLNRHGQAGPLVSTPMIAIGSTDQHSLLQQMMEGEKDKLITVFKVLSMAEISLYQVEKSHFAATQVLSRKSLGQLINRQADATAEALSSVGQKVMQVDFLDLSDRSIGFQLMSWMLVVGLIGEVLEINAFDQPGVELGKVLTQKKLI